MRILFYLVILAVVVLLLREIFARNGKQVKLPKSPFRFRKKNTKEMWVQVYDTDSLEEVQALQARLEEEDLDCFVYEQGRKDIHGNPLKGFGIAVPRTSVPHAQKVIARMPA